MPEALEEIQLGSQEHDYAISLQEMEMGLPIFGRISGMTDELKEVNKELPFNFRQPFNVVKAMFRLEPGLYTLHTGLEDDMQIGFRIDPTESKSGDEMLSTTGKTTTANADSSFYRNRTLRLEGELHDADRKIRQQVDEIMNLKRELAEDKTATLLTHQKELSDLKESHRNEIDRLKEIHRGDLKNLEQQIGELQQMKFRMEMEQRAGGRDAGSRMLDMLEENAPMFFGIISQLFAAQKQGIPAADQAVNAHITEEQAQALAASLKQELQPEAYPQAAKPNAHLRDEVTQSNGAGNPSPRHLPADREPSAPGLTGDEDRQPLHAIFGPEQRNGQENPAISI